jgi:hypothetical protein
VRRPACSVTIAAGAAIWNPRAQHTFEHAKLVGRGQAVRRGLGRLLALRVLLCSHRHLERF